MLLEGRVSKSNIGKSLGARVARMLYGREGGNGPQIEKLLNLYSLIGPEYINNRHFPLGDINIFNNDSQNGLRYALNNYKERVGLYNPLATQLIMDLNKEGIKARFEDNDINPYKDTNRITDEDLSNIGEPGFIRAWKPNKYIDQYKNILKQLTPYPDYDTGTVNLRGRYDNTLPQWLKRYSHPLQIDIEY